eukprot:CAMPEP_0172503118 /NCGR_PEP_ID=MMETSP1066-20121228/166356_1 /TAXON_ID=671091 /ORGANISM="Coscinodiscus wailesii, Strain CCMP2513" /LENGTH=123 /DNA_ID=CAMNT_0013278721 /DNA_START=262 /DNA_END=630 /DNA_ORIENTATION=+
MNHNIKETNPTTNHVNYQQYLAAHAAANNNAMSKMPCPLLHPAASTMPCPPPHLPDNDDVAMPDVPAIDPTAAAVTLIPADVNDAMKLHKDSNTPKEVRNCTTIAQHETPMEAVEDSPAAADC